MTFKSLGNPFSSKTDLRHGADSAAAVALPLPLRATTGCWAAVVHGHDGRINDGCGAGVGVSAERGEGRYHG
jgi:hypothetical protein